MELLISVRSAEEADTALAAGADIVDTKEPRRGSLGPVTAETLAQILNRVPSSRPVSIALGDVATVEDVLRMFSSLPQPSRRITYLKLGFAGVSDATKARRLLEAARGASRSSSTRIVAVAYADAGRAGSAPPPLICRAAAEAGVAGILFDTHTKGVGNLLTWIDPAVLKSLIAMARSHGLLAAVAGGLKAKDLSSVVQARPDVVGFRGAACRGGREGRLSKYRVKQLRQCLAATDSGFLQGQLNPELSPVGETPEDPANLCDARELTY